MGADERLAALKLELPRAPKAMANYRPAVRIGNLIYVSGHGPYNADGTLHVGRVGAEVGLEAGVAAARQIGLAVLATLRDQLGSLDAVARVIKVLGMVNATHDFVDHPKVINGFSDLMVEVFGEDGRGARSAIGVASLPSNISVEIEGIFEVRD